MPLLYICLSILLGIFTGSLITFSLWALLIPAAALIPVVFLPRWRKLILWSALCLLVFVGAALRYQSAISPREEIQASFYNDCGIVSLEGVISDFPEVKNSTLAFRLSVEYLIRNETKTAVSGDIQVFVPFYRHLKYGDRLIVRGEPATPRQFDDFDYRGYLANQGIYSVMYYPAVEKLESTSGFNLLVSVNDLRNALADSLTRCLPEPQCSLAQGVLLGLRGGIPDSMMQSFYKTGTTHLLAISGLNLTIILGIVLFFTIWLFGRQNKIYIWVSMSLIWLYSMLAGMPATVVRAAIMGSVFLLAEMLGRQRNVTAALLLAAASMVLAEPSLLWNVSFQLSFISMLGLAYIMPAISGMIENPVKKAQNQVLTRLRNFIVPAFGTTLAAILATWPLLALNFHSFSLISIPATFFAMPAFPGIILLSFFTALTGLVFHPLGTLSGYVAWLLISYFLLVLQIFSAIPGIYLNNISLQSWQVAVYYLSLIAVLLIIRFRTEAVRYLKLIGSSLATVANKLASLPAGKYALWMLAVLLAANMIVWLAVMSLPDGKLHVYVLDVGQGDAILIRTPSGRNVVIDTGPDPRAATFQVGNYLPFWDRTIDLLILTQPQADHITGSLQMLKSYQVQKLAIADCVGSDQLMSEIITGFRQGSGEVLLLSLGQQFSLGQDVYLKVLNLRDQYSGSSADDINNNSLVTRLCWNEISFLFTADIEEEAEHYLMENRADLESDVLKVAHHGSRGSSSEGFLAVVKPAAAVISTGADNRFGHPHAEAIERLKDHIDDGLILQTSLNGTVEFITDGERLWYKVEKNHSGD